MVEEEKMSNEKFYKIGLGTWKMGGGAQPDPDNDDAADIAMIENAIDLGIRHIDTAEAYADGKAEKLVGQAVSGYKRSELFIASKVRAEKLAYDDVLKSCEGSLKRLGLEQLDLFYVHKPNPLIPVKETARAFNRLLEKAMIKEVGLSNVSINTIKEYNKYLEKPVFAVQNQYSLIVRQSVESGVLEYCQQNNINFVAWRPLQPAVPDLGIKSLYKPGAYPLLDELASKYGVSNAQLAIRWLTEQDKVNVIFKTGNPDHLQQILDADKIRLAHKDWERLKNDFPLQLDFGIVSSGRLELI